MKTFIPLSFLSAFVAMAFAAEFDQPSKMTKITTRLTSEATKTDVAAGRLKTLYRAGKKYSRLEEEPDPERGLRRLIVTNEPESWVINLEDQTGKHFLDAGPNFSTKVPIFWGADGKPDPDFEALEFAEEEEFFAKGKARVLGARNVDGRNCKALSMVRGSAEVILYLERKSGRPLQVELLKSGRPVATVRYFSYEENLPFDPALFEPPKSVMMMPGENP